MNATDLLKEQHREVRDLFKRLEAATSPALQRELFEEIAKNLVAHDVIERKLFYPACEAVLGMTDQLGEALVEHGVVEFCLFEADEAMADQFKYKCTVLREMLDHHIDEEEDEFFPQVEKALGKERLLSLGDEMQTRFDEVVQTDFRPPLHDNLWQVLSGAMKPKSNRAAAREAQAAARRKPAVAGNRAAGASAGRAGARSRAQNGSKSKTKRSSQRAGARRHA